jgi:hypothetical protein
MAAKDQPVQSTLRTNFERRNWKEMQTL